MPKAAIGRHQINYSLQGPAGGPVVVFVNGLTQYLQLWGLYAARLPERGIQVLSYDMLGQGGSSKPVLSISMEDHVQVLAGLLKELGINKAHVAGISFGGIVALRFALEHPRACASVVAMSTFAELTPQLEMLAGCLYEGMTQVGLPYLQSLLMPMNVSSKWLAANRAAIPEMKRRGFITNDLYALQNLMESFVDFKPFLHELPRLRCPALILHGEYDFLTSRECHEALRVHIPTSRLVIIQHGFHAFTLEYPLVVLRQVEDFVRAVDGKTWRGDQSVWIANDDPEAPVAAFPFPGDHLRLVPVPRPVPAAPHKPRAARPRKPAARAAR